jgi:arginine-tRNA-protein transferase
MDNGNLPPPVAVRLTVLPEQECPYLPDRRAANRAFYVDRLPDEVYRAFMDAGFRRNGKVIYQPVCRECRACVPIRVVVDRFQPDKSQRRCVRRNGDLIVTEVESAFSEEKFDLYRRYITGWHGKPTNEAEDGRESFESFLCESPVHTIEFDYRGADGRLLAVGICDVSESSLSSVYFYFDPAERRRGLGTYGALHEIAWAKRAKIAYYYLGYWVEGCGAMEYKNKFRPHELLNARGQWEMAVSGGGSASGSSPVASAGG